MPSRGGDSGSSTPIISYLGLTKPAGYTPDYVALYQFDASADDLNDRTGNGHTLTLAAGGPTRRVVRNGLQGHAYVGLDEYHRSAVDSSLVSLAAATLEMVAVPGPGAFSAQEDALFVVGGDPASELEPENFIFALRANANSGSFYAFHEHGAGVNDTGQLGQAMLSIGKMQYLVLTRDSDGQTYRLYIDGTLMGTVDLVNPPTGGANSRIYVGGFDAGFDWDGEVYCCRWSHGTMTQAQVTEVNNSLR
jgi:hypothetical protein